MIKLAFYPQRNKFKKLVGGQFAHVEIVFSDGLSFSAEKDGVRFKIQIKSGMIYQYYPIPLDQERIIRNWCEKIVGDSYDEYGWLRCTIPFAKKHPRNDVWHCGHLCVVALQQIGYFEGVEAHRISPSKLWKIFPNKKTLCYPIGNNANGLFSNRCWNSDEQIVGPT